MNYRLINHRISEFLATHLDAIYEINTEQKCEYNTLPNGIMGLSVILSGKAWILENNIWTPVPEICTYGLIKRPGLIRMSAGCREISITFPPPLFRSFIKNSMKEIAGSFTDAECIFDKSALADFKNSFQNALNDLQILSAIEKFLKQHYFEKNVDQSAIVAYKLISEKESVRVSALAAELKVPNRTLLNKFNNSIGLSPIELLKVLRIKRALKIGINNGQTLTQLAMELGYYDQAHFIHDFKNTLGLLPENYFKNNLLVADFYNSGRWLLR